MTNPPPFASIETMGADAGAIASKHVDLAFRTFLRKPHAANEPHAAIEERFVRLITGAPHPFGNFTLVADGADAEGVAAAIAPLRDLAAPAAALFVGPVGAAAAAQLETVGFAAHDPMPAMVVDIAALAATALPDGYSFARVGEGAEGEEWAEVFSVGYELPPEVGRVFGPNAIGAPAGADAAVQFFAVRKAGRMVATSCMCLGRGVAGIYCVATIPDERKRGLGAHLTAEPLRLARAPGYGVGVLQSSEAGHPVYRKLGFHDVGEVALFVRIPG